ncbi:MULTISPECIES: hypothetical protein [Streptococcus]|uniref:hypothetical protein n=1 Tax=Streptococcus TaxID=1301 RepID=UPI0002B93E35|nr:MULTISPECIES: hypothetical protein [Streptococcus]EPT37493.1 hypothetical protein SAG0029_00385 [Streptococcus agalactiae FSL S3-501]VTS27652.1 Uncharacterised protein [Streptococcus dysgalactiae subsp. equisimilis]VTS37273.1 Uncharacterised protein [Streptococcus dysgalactiae subsp. equisimilis]
MPLQFKESGTSVYAINYKHLIGKLFELEIDIFQDKDIQKYYFKQWQTVLERAEKNDLENYFPYYSSHGTNDQYFTYQFFLGEQEYFLHFNISHLIELLELTEIPSENIPTKEFSDPQSDIFWKKPTDGKRSLSYGKPIIMIPLYIGTYNHIVIDGNHRIQDALAKSEESIPLQYIDTLTLLESNTFFTSFDQLFYAFLCELKLMTLEKDDDDSSLLKKSYLHYRYNIFNNIPSTSQPSPLLWKWLRKIMSSFPWSKR